MTSPLFTADIATLKQRLRLSGVATGGDAEAIIDNAVLAARVGFFRKLGAARVNTLLAISYVVDPTTDEEALRAMANITEVLWVKSELLCNLPTLFMDSSGDLLQVWNDEGAFRETELFDAKSLAKDIQNTISSNLDILSGDETIGNESGIRSLTIQADNFAIYIPGQTVFDFVD